MSRIPVRQALAGLGRTTDEVAVNLSKLGCQGTRGSKTHCPLAVFLNQHAVVAWPGFSVHPDYLIFYDGLRADYQLPAHVAEFVAKFDKGAYPYLERVTFSQLTQSAAGG